MKPAKKSKITVSTHGEIRIIGGQWRRSLLPVAAIEGLRPTPNRVRETLFNWLGQDLTGLKCVDAFAGTGALGFEAASRGAAMVLMCERDPLLERALIASRDRLGATNMLIQRGDSIAMLASLPAAGQDVIFLDPPFAGDLYLPALKAAAKAIKHDGFIYLEADRAWLQDELAAVNLQISRHGKAGAVHYHLLTICTQE
jgi:16S rRNA (guanine966-N2)-methyltransferase